MNEREQIQKALSAIRASEELLEEVMVRIDNKERKKISKFSKSGKTILVAAAVLVLLVVTAFAADYVINRREVYFFDTVEEMAEAWRETEENEAFSYSVPGSMKDNRDLETVAEHVAWVMCDGFYGEDETVLSEETDDFADTLWERRKVTGFRDEDLGSVTAEYLTGAAYGERIVIDGLLDWDVSSVLETMTPEEDAQIVSSVRKVLGGSIVRGDALLGYTTEEGKRFQIDYQYDKSMDFGKAEYILSSAYDYCAVYTTNDGVEVLLQEYDGQIWADAEYCHAAVRLYTTGCTVEEIKSILDDLELQIPLSTES